MCGKGVVLSKPFQHKMTHRYTWRRDETGEHKSIIDYIAEDEN